MKRAIPWLWVALIGGIVLLVVIVIVLDNFLIQEQEWTISYNLQRIGMDQPVVPFVLGLIVGALGGHFWWRNRPPDQI
jgi:hypothetical protein